MQSICKEKIISLMPTKDWRHYETISHLQIRNLRLREVKKEKAHLPKNH